MFLLLNKSDVFEVHHLRGHRDNHLNFFVPEREEEPFAVLCPQTVDAASVYCASQVVIHLVMVLIMVMM